MLLVKSLIPVVRLDRCCINMVIMVVTGQVLEQYGYPGSDIGQVLEQCDYPGNETGLVPEQWFSG